MEQDASSTRVILFSSGTVLLWVAVGLAVVFLGILFYDLVRRRQRRRHHRREPEGPAEKLVKPFRRVRAFQIDLWKALHHRARQARARRDEPPAAPP
jgi:hypothetical protein